MPVTPDQVYGDSEWLRSNPALIAKFSQILINSGIVPDAATLGRYGLSSLFDPATSAAAANNPYSTAATLKNTLSGSLSSNAHTANAHGGLFSGAFQNMQDQSGRDYQRSYAGAGASTLSDLLGIGGQQNDLYNSIFGRKQSEAAAAQAAADAAYTPPAAAPAAIGAGLPVPQQAYNRTGPETPGQVFKPPPKKKPTFADALHAAGGRL